MYEAKNTPRILRMRDMPSKVGLRPSTIYQLVQAGKFPPPFKLVFGGRASGWLEEQIDSWLAAQSSRRGVVDSLTDPTGKLRCKSKKKNRRKEVSQ
jgi:predicted DNA-binding transcriptional regulator AlpA